MHAFCLQPIITQDGCRPSRKRNNQFLQTKGPFSCRKMEERTQCKILCFRLELENRVWSCTFYKVILSIYVLCYEMFHLGGNFLHNDKTSLEDVVIGFSRTCDLVSITKLLSDREWLTGSKPKVAR